MTEKKIIAASIQVDTGNSNAAVKELNENTRDLKGNLKDTGATAKTTGKEVEGSGQSFGKLKGEISGLPGPLGQAGQGVSKLNATFKALLANPIVLIITLIVGALALLYKAFTSTNDGADKMEQVFKGVGAAVDVIRDRILKAASAIAKFFSGDFKGALAESRSAVKGIGAEIASEFREAAGAIKNLQEVEDAMRSLGVSRAKLNRDLAGAKEIITDENATLEEKRKAIEQVREAEGKQTAQELENAKDRLDAIRTQNKISDTSDRDLQKEADAQSELYQLEEKSANDKRTLNKQSRTIEREAEAKAKEARSAAIAAEKEARQKLTEFNNNLLKLQQENELLLIKDSYEKETKALEQKIFNDKRLNELALKEGRLNRKQFDTIQDALDIQANLQRDLLKEKHNKEVEEKEVAFQKELNAIATKIKLDGITDTRELERIQLNIGYEEKLQDAIVRYKDDQEKFIQIKAALDEQIKSQQKGLEEKFKKEDDRAAFEARDERLKEFINEQNFEFDAKRLALEKEIKLVQDAFDSKLLSEKEYNAKVKELSGKRIEIDTLELNHKKAQVSEVAGVLSGLAELIGKQTIAGKALGIATALINTYQGASEAIKQKSTLPSPFDVIAKVASVATIIATGLKTVKAIAAVNVPGGGGGGGGGVSISGLGESAPFAPQQSSTAIDKVSIEAIGNAAAGGVNRNIRAYIYNSDITNERERDERLTRASRLGG